MSSDYNLLQFPPNSMDETGITNNNNKRPPFEESNSANKKARGAHCLKQVAEMVLVLSAMGRIRAGGKPTKVEVNIMTEARGKLAGICNEFAPKDVFPRDASRMVIEDLGFNGKLEMMSIAQKLQLTKEKMEKSEVFPIHSATYTPPDSSRSFQNNSSAAHASPISNSRTLPYQLPTSEVRPVGSTVLTSTDSFADHKPSHASSRSTQSQSASSDNNTGLSNNVTNINQHKQHQMNLSVNTHNEIAKIVQKVLHPHSPGQRAWTPPSRDYMSKPLACQTCKSMINEVDNVIICDACEKGYHLRCLQCNPKSVFGDECREWHCDKCLAISNGKPLPLKYGRVMRNVNMPKRSASSAVGQPCLDNTVASSDENCNQQLTSSNGQDADVCSKALAQNGESGKNEEVIERGNMVKTSEICATVRENDVEWVGGVINEIDGKMYYGSCCVSGTTFKLQDYALFSFTGDNLMPNKLQSMWEDNKTNKKWLTVTRCFFPDDLPEGVGRPCSPESNEVYESNHEIALPAGLIHGPCRVLPPRKLSEEKEGQTHSQTETFDESERFFLCKWFYDEKKHLFRDVMC